MHVRLRLQHMGETEVLDGLRKMALKRLNRLQPIKGITTWQPSRKTPIYRANALEIKQVK